MSNNSQAPYFGDRFVLLARHAAVDRDAISPTHSWGILNVFVSSQGSDQNIPPQPNEQPLSKEGKKQAREVVAQFTEFLDDLPRDSLRLGPICHGSYLHVAEMAQIFADILIARGYAAQLEKSDDFLDPPNFGPYENRTTVSNFKEKLEQILGLVPDEGQRNTDANQGTNTVIVVGHQPFLGWLAHVFTGRPVAIARSELVCLRYKKLGFRARLLTLLKKRTFPTYAWQFWWGIEPSDPSTFEALTAKIQSKMNLAMLLGGFVGIVFGWIFSNLREAEAFSALYQTQQVAYFLSGATLIFSIGAYFASMYAYDRLLMPTRFWAEKPGSASELPDDFAWRPPSSNTRVLFDNMMRVWYGLFTPATVSAVIGLGLYAYAVFPAGAAVQFLLYWFIGLIVVGVLIIGIYLKFRPRLGTDD